MSFNSFMVKLTFKKYDICNDCEVNIGHLAGWEIDLGFKNYLCNECIFIREVNREVKRRDRLNEHEKRFNEVIKTLKKCRNI